MGIPLYREVAMVAPSPAIKLPAVCPYAAESHGLRHHHHHHAGSAQAQSQSQARMTAEETSGDAPSMVVSRAWRNLPRQHLTRDRTTERATESHERSTAASNRLTQRIVRSPPGTREHEDEMVAADIVELYFQEMARLRSSQMQQQFQIQLQQRQQQHQPQADLVEESAQSPSDAARAREVLSELVRRGQTALTAPTSQPSASGLASIHESLLRQQQRRALRVDYASVPPTSSLARTMPDQDVTMEAEEEEDEEEEMPPFPL